jgi:DNA-binding cell septation regulator SpoVG
LGCLLAVSFVAVDVNQLYAADEIYVTSVEKAPVEDGGAVKEMATIVLNDCIKVKEIQVIKVGGRISLKYPTYVSKAGKEYPQFEPLTKQAKDEIEKAIESGKPSSKSSKQISYKVSKFSRFTRQSALKVFAAVDFNNAVRVECKVMESGKGPWISFPSRKPEGGGKWVKQILLTNKKLKDAVEKALMDKYKSSASESSEENE